MVNLRLVAPYQGDIVCTYEVARRIIAQNQSFLGRYDEWDDTRRSLQAFSNVALHALCIDLALEQNARISMLVNQGHLSKLSQKEFEGLCSHVYYEVRRRHLEYKDATSETDESDMSPDSVSFTFKQRRPERCSVVSTIPMTAQRLIPLDVMELCSTIYHITKDKSKYRALLNLRGNDAQVILDFLQMALDSQWLHADVQKRLLITTLKLSSKSSLYPKCLTLEGVTVEESAVTAGHFGEIWKGSFQGHAVCLKVVKVYQRSRIDDLLKAFSKEGIIWGHLCHENVLPFYGIYHLSDACGRICLTSPWMESGNVTEHLKRNPDANRIHLVLDAIEGISYLHDSGVIHGDLKGANILISPRGRACLADFGLSTVVDAEIVRWTSLDSSSRIGGTIRWSAPELMDPENENTRPSTASDIYAFSCVCYEVFTGTNPFHEISRDPAVMLKVMRGERPSLPPWNSLPRRRWGLTPNVWSLMEQCWQQEPSKRPAACRIIDTIHQISPTNLGDDWFAGDARNVARSSWESISPSKFRNAFVLAVVWLLMDAVTCVAFQELIGVQNDSSKSCRGIDPFVGLHNILTYLPNAQQYLHRI